MSSYEADREREAVGPNEPTKWNLWRDEQGLDSDSEREDLSDGRHRIAENVHVRVKGER